MEFFWPFCRQNLFVRQGLSIDRAEHTYIDQADVFCDENCQRGVF
jgi:hypothetical protein